MSEVNQEVRDALTALIRDHGIDAVKAVLKVVKLHRQEVLSKAITETYVLERVLADQAKLKEQARVNDTGEADKK